MNGVWQVVVTLAGTALFNAVLGAFLYGKLTQRVKDLTGWNRQQDQRLDDHDKTLMRYQGQIAYIKGHAGMGQGE